tara:strand:- start:1 stop:1185 length:1185 start_codon:yes stop_codon:yes gene_type:complete
MSSIKFILEIKKLIFILFLFTLLFPAKINYSLFASGFKKAVFITGHPTNSSELYVVEQRGMVWKISNGEKNKEPFLDIRKKVHNPIFPGDERGLLGLAFSPQFDTNRLIYINYINNNNETIISRFNTSNGIEEILINFEQPYSNHNGGMMAFGHDNYLYIAVGDGGGAGDPLKHAQNLNTFFGSILRIDVNTESGYEIPESNPFVNRLDALPEIWVYGLRNPWRFSFDKEKGDLYIGDVGQNSWEEINFQSANSSGGENYGWNYFEGFDNFVDNPSIDNQINPIHVYPNNANIYKVILGWDEDDVYGCSVTGGYVYNGNQIKSLKGYYLFADYCTGRIWAFQFANNQVQNLKELTKDINLNDGKGTIYISSFGQDADGELYIIDYSGDIYKLIN